MIGYGYFIYLFIYRSHNICKISQFALLRKNVNSIKQTGTLQYARFPFATQKNNLWYVCIILWSWVRYHVHRKLSALFWDKIMFIEKHFALFWDKICQSPNKIQKESNFLSLLRLVTFPIWLNMWVAGSDNCFCHPWLSEYTKLHLI